MQLKIFKILSSSSVLPYLFTLKLSPILLSKSLISLVTARNSSVTTWDEVISDHNSLQRALSNN